MLTKNIIYSLALILIFQGSAVSQKQITLDAIWTDFTFYTKNVSGFNFNNDGVHYTKLEDNKIVVYDIASGKKTDTLLDGDELKGRSDFIGFISNYSFSHDEEKILIASETEQIYRRSSRSKFHIYNIKSGVLVPLYPEGKIMYAAFSPIGTDVAFVFDNNLYSKNLSTGLITQITFDGKHNEVINGAADWVYEEEFLLSRSFFWSPEGDQIAYLKFDESKVKEFTITKYNGDLYPTYESFKYPKVGENNSIVTVHLYNLETGKRSQVQIDETPNYYIPRIKWTNNNNELTITALNRHQNHLKLYRYNIQNQNLDVLINERNKYYIDIKDILTFLPDNKHFIWSSDESGFHHLYLYNLKSKKRKMLTDGAYEVTDFYGYDPDRKVLYFQSSINGSQDRQVCQVDLEGNHFEIITKKAGWNDAQFSSTYDYYTIEYSNFNTPPKYTVFDQKGNSIRNIEDNDHIETLQKAYDVTEGEFFEMETSDKVKLNGWMIKPPDYDATKSYPLFMFVYGGPGSQQVTDKWKGNNYWWFQLLAQKGYIIACVDNRGTGGKGEEFRKMTYLQLGYYETKDQIEAAMFLGRKPFIDAKRIGIFGWSYGGFLSTNALLKGSEVFAAGIAVAPVTNWKWYDTVYTERYMKTVKENQEGFRLNSPVNYAHRLRGKYLLVHGTGDDNVHLQHTTEMMNALIKANKQYDAYIYPNRNHGIYGENARLHLYTKMTDFIIENI